MSGEIKSSTTAITRPDTTRPIDIAGRERIRGIFVEAPLDVNQSNIELRISSETHDRLHESCSGGKEE